MSFKIRMKEYFSSEKRQFITFLILSFCILVFALVLVLVKTEEFQSFFGPIHPMIVIPLVIIIGLILLSYLLYNDFFQIYKREDLKKLYIVSLLALFFFIAVIPIDVFFPYAEDINVLFPKSLIYYPTMGFVVEILFHVLPLFILVVPASLVFKKVDKGKIIFASIFIVAAIEPLFQYFFSTAAQPVWVQVLDGIRLYLFGIAQLYVFMKKDFMSMYLFRIVYYVFWHIIWGVIRLEFLFP